MTKPDLGRPRPIDVLTSVAYEYRVRVEEITGHGPGARKNWISKARQRAMLRLSEECKLGPAAIGRLLDRDHSSVCYGIQVARKLREEFTL